MANLNLLPYKNRGEKDLIMKIIFSSISRLIFSYCKFVASLILLSSVGTFAHSSETPTYLKCGGSYYQLTGKVLRSNYNVRTKNFQKSRYVKSYTENWITTDYLVINRNNGELKVNGKVICVMKKITFNELPKLNDEGKLF